MPRKSPNKKVAPKPRVSSNAEDPLSLEANIVRMATSGELAKIAPAAIAKHKGLPLTFLRGNQIIKRFPDGREEVLGTISRKKYRMPKNVPIIGST